MPVRERGKQAFFRRNRELKGALKTLDPPVRRRHEQWLLTQLAPGGGFRGRAGGSDLYYTGFGLQALSALNPPPPKVVREWASFLRSQEPVTIVDQLQWLQAVLLLQDLDFQGAPEFSPKQALTSFLESFRSPSGGYGKHRGAGEGSVYWTYLAALSYDLYDINPPDPAGLIEFLRQRKRADGAFGETSRGKQGSSNATAAGLGLAMLLDAGTREGLEEGVKYLLSVQIPGSGFRANALVPVPDLLTTFTALLILTQAGAAESADLLGALRFVQSCEAEEGGFRAGPWDDAADVEYTYYGFSCQALLSGM